MGAKVSSEHITAVKDTLACLDARVGALEFEGTSAAHKGGKLLAEVTEADKITPPGKIRQGLAPEIAHTTEESVPPSAVGGRRMPTSSELIRRARGIGVQSRNP